MTTPVKQLKDEDGNTFYPHTAKSAIADFPVETADIRNSAVTTAKIADAAVTSQKIDFTTIKDEANAMPIKNKTIEIGWGLKCDLQRCGNLIVACAYHTLNGTPTGHATETIPEGFRPAVNGGITVFKETYDGSAGYAEYNFSTTGSIYVNAHYGVGSGDFMWGARSWFTNDPWPTS